MKNTFFKTVSCLTLAILTLSTFMQTEAAAQDAGYQDKGDASMRAESSAGLVNAKKLEGSWNHQGARLNCQTGAVIGTFSAMFTFNSGGTLWEAGTQVSPALRSSSHGVWSDGSRGQYTTAFQFFRFNADGTLAGRQIVRQEILLSDDGDSYTATATAQVLDVNGNVIANNCAAGAGTRFE